MREIRATILGLQRHTLPGRQLRAEILSVIDGMAPSLGARPNVHFDGPIDVVTPELVADELLTSLREALANVARHARASTVDVVVEAGPEIVLKVVDDGQGINEVGRSAGHGRGLKNLEARANDLGGSLTVRRRTSGGTSLTWRVPLTD